MPEYEAKKEVSSKVQIDAMQKNLDQHKDHARDDFDNVSSPPSSKVQIDALNQKRHKPTPKLEYTPDDPVTKYVMNDEAMKENATLDRRVNAMQKRLDRRKHQAQRDFAKTKDNELGR